MRLRRSLRLGIDGSGWRADQRSGEGLEKLLEKAGQLFLRLLGDLPCRTDRFENLRCLRPHFGTQGLLEPGHVLDLDAVKEPTDAGKDHHYLLFDRQRLILRLLQELGKSRAARQQTLRRRVEV